MALCPLPLEPTLISRNGYDYEYGFLTRYYQFDMRVFLRSGLTEGFIQRSIANVWQEGLLFAATSATYTLLKSGSIAISSFLYSFFIIITNFRRLSIGSKNGKCFRTFPHCIFKPSAYHALGFWVPFSVFYVRHSVIPSHFWNCIVK